MHKVEISIYLDEPVYDKMDEAACENFGTLAEDAMDGPLLAVVEYVSEALKKELPPEQWSAMRILVRP